MPVRGLLKVCCIQEVAELRMAERAGATHVGLVGAMPSGPGVLSDSEIARLASEASKSTTTVLLTSRVAADDIVAHMDATGVHVVQIVNTVSPDVREAVRVALPDARIIQVVHVEGPESVAVAESAEIGSDHVLLDSGRPSASRPELGGTGRTHDWSVSAEIVRRLDVPVVLAGGLTPENVREAFAAVRPGGVDVCSGLRGSDFALDADRLERFVDALGPGRQSHLPGS